MSVVCTQGWSRICRFLSVEPSTQNFKSISGDSASEKPSTVHKVKVDFSDKNMCCEVSIKCKVVLPAVGNNYCLEV